MDHATVRHATHTLSRSFRAPLARLFQAMADPGIRLHWATPSDDIAMAYERADFSVGGEDIAHCTGAFAFTVRSRYLDIRQDARIVMSEVIEVEGAPIGASLVSIEMRADGDGSALVVTLQTAGLDGSGLESEAVGGWNTAFDRLDRLLGRG
jgi:uncharacterized protein YndB with AHSA1/START domain